MKVILAGSDKRRQVTMYQMLLGLSYTSVYKMIIDRRSQVRSHRYYALGFRLMVEVNDENCHRHGRQLAAR
jgi:hypothetical protein